MDSLKEVTYCGLYCQLCSNCGRVPQQAKALKETMTRDGWPNWGGAIPNFESFWGFLEWLVTKDCPGCRSGQCGDPDCKIRQCAQEREVVACAFCDEFPCAHMQAFSRRYPTVIADSQRLKEMGVEAWIAVMERRRQDGFCYADSRYET